MVAVSIGMKRFVVLFTALFASADSFAFLSCSSASVDELQLMTTDELHKKYCYEAGQFDVNMSTYELLRDPKDGADAKQCMEVMKTVNLVYRKQAGQLLDSKSDCQDFKPK